MVKHSYVQIREFSRFNMMGQNPWVGPVRVTTKQVPLPILFSSYKTFLDLVCGKKINAHSELQVVNDQCFHSVISLTSQEIPQLHRLRLGI